MSNYKTGLVITGDATGGIRAVRATDDELGRLSRGFDRTGKGSKQFARDLKSGSGELKMMTTIARTAALSLGGLFAAGGFSNLFASAIRETEQLQRNMLRTEQLIKTTGSAAGFSAQQLHEQARQLAFATLQSTEDIMSAQQILLSYSNIAGENFTRAIESATDLSSLIGGNLNTSLEMLAKTLDDPVKGINAMARQGIYFDESQQKVIKSLVKTNRLAEAQAIILDELAGQFGGVARSEAVGLAGAQDTLAQSIQEAKLAYAEKLKLIESSTSLYNSATNAVVSLTDNMDTSIQIAQLLAIAIGAKLTGALSAVVAAKIAAQIQSIRYQATLARMAGVTATAAASQTALAVSISTASRAMMILGGPVGVALLAAGTLYTFREELGLTNRQSDITTEGLLQVAQSIKSMDGAIIDNNLELLSQDLQEVSLRASESRLRVLQLQRQLSAFGQSSGDTADGSNMGASHAKQWGAEATRVAANLASARKDIEAEEALIEQINDSINRLNGAPQRERGNVSALNMSESISKQAAKLQKDAGSYFQELSRMRATDIQQVEFWKDESLIRLRDYHRQGLLTTQQFKDGESMIIAEANQRLIDIEEKRWERLLDGSLSSLAKLREEAAGIQGPRGEIIRRRIEGDIASQTFNGISDSSFIDPSVGGASSEMDRLQRERDQILEAYEQRIEDYRAFRELEVENKDIYDQQIEALESRRRTVIIESERAMSTLRMQLAEDTFRSLHGLAVAFGGEQSKLARVMFGIEKGYAVAKALINIPKAYSDAFAATVGIPVIGPFLAPVAGATAAGIQVAQAASIRSAQPPSFDGGGWTGDGPRAGGVDGKGGFYAIMHPREYVTDTTKANTGGQAGVTVQPKISINVIETSDRPGRMESRQVDDEQQIDIFISDLYGDGKRSQALQSVFGLQRQGV